MTKFSISQLASLCLQNKVQITTAESCTGGLVAKLITDQAGSSQWFERGFVTYSNTAKEQMLGVEHSLLEQWGAVSEPVAKAMAEGALSHSDADFALSITGIAGPDGGSAEKPVGTVCFGWAWYAGDDRHIKGSITTRHFQGDRDTVRNQSAYYALEQLFKLIQS